MLCLVSLALTPVIKMYLQSKSSNFWHLLTAVLFEIGQSSILQSVGVMEQGVVEQMKSCRTSQLDNQLPFINIIRFSICIGFKPKIRMSDQQL